VIKDYFPVGADYPLADFVARSRTALRVASERVRAKHGMPCSRALAQLGRIEAAAAAFSDVSDARVTIEGFDE
jgi:uncharacterized repeat protein (TIGR04042 family)